MPVAVNDIFLATYKGSCFGQTIMLTMTYRASTVVGAIQDIAAQGLLAEQLAGDTTGETLDTYLKCLSTAYTGEEVWAQKILPIRYRKSVLGLQDAVGQAGGSALTNVAAAVEMVTNLAGRDQIATKKVGPIALPSVLVADGKLTEDYMDLLGNLALNLRAPITVLSGDLVFTPVIFHKDKTPASDDITGTVLHDTVRVNRRRTVGVGI